MMREIENRSEMSAWLDDPHRPEAAVQALDLRDWQAELMAGEFPNSLFIACPMDSEVLVHLIQTGAQVIPKIGTFAFREHRSKLYSPGDLFSGFKKNDRLGYKNTQDYKIYKEYLDRGGVKPGSIRVSLARRLHDHSITDALMEVLAGRKVVAIMGGHGMERQDPFFAQVAELSRLLTQQGFLLISGGGPGAMEATHLGAYFATRPIADMNDAIDEIKVRPASGLPGKEYLDEDWLDRAWTIMEKYPLSDAARNESMSVGIPTWLYGHEPPTPFATHIAKYFANSVREDGLLMVATHGVVFAPGSAGTTQEIFQDAAQNHYGTAGYYSPMILFGEEYWTSSKPVWPLLKQLSSGQKYGELLELTDSVETIARRIQEYRPELYKKPDS